MFLSDAGGQGRAAENDGVPVLCGLGRGSGTGGLFRGTVPLLARATETSPRNPRAVTSFSVIFTVILVNVVCRHVCPQLCPHVCPQLCPHFCPQLKLRPRGIARPTILSTTLSTTQKAPRGIARPTILSTTLSTFPSTYKWTEIWTELWTV